LSLRFPSRIVSVDKINGNEKLTEIDHVENEVMCALWAWETFGGIGGRTRRGFGALSLTKVNNSPAKPWPADIAKLRARLTSELGTHALFGVNHPGVPQISPDISFAFTSIKAISNVYDIKKKTRANALIAWKSLIEQLQDFRQDRYGGRLGKSKWPEPNEIRGRADLPLRIAEEAEDRELVHKFPRAVFGLPIIFHLPQDSGKPEFHLIGNRLGDGSSDKYVERLSSPLILRPLACEDGKAIGLAMILQTEKTPPRGLHLKGDARNDPQPDAELDESEALLIEPLKGQPDILQAFLNRLR
jgi:CRISPR-associated protein Cmr1